MTPSQFVGKIQESINKLMSAQEELSALYKQHVSLGTSYTDPYFKIDDPENPGTLIDNPALYFTSADFTSTFWAFKEATDNIEACIDTYAGTLNKIRTR